MGGPVRCEECESEPLKTARFCECCGVESPTHEETQHEDLLPFGDETAERQPDAPPPFADWTEETQPAEERGELVEAIDDDDDWAPNPSRRFGAHCRDCGKPLDGERCQVCQDLVASAQPADPAPAAAADVPSPELIATAAPAQPVAEAAPSVEAQSPAAAPAASPAPSVEAATKPPDSPAAGAKTVDHASAKTEDPANKQARTRPARPDRAPRPADTPKRVPAPVASQRQRPSIALTAAAAIFVVIGIGAPWLRLRNAYEVAPKPPQAAVVPSDAISEIASVGETPVPEERPAPPIAPQVTAPAIAAAPAATAPTPPPVSAAPKVERKPTPIAVAKAPVPGRDKPLTPAKPVRGAAAPSAATKPAPAKEPIREASAAPLLAAAPLVAPSAVPVAAAAPAPAPAPAAPSLPTGPFFEAKDVNEAPRVATRVEPRLPAELRARSGKEMVVVRVLVSQAGRPSRVSLLRRSKAGAEVDDLVVAAVDQWTFSPANKKGEAVSCWYNLAVQVGGNE